LNGVTGAARSPVLAEVGPSAVRISVGHGCLTFSVSRLPIAKIPAHIASGNIGGIPEMAEAVEGIHDCLEAIAENLERVTGALPDPSMN
jgi:hypothetical protein